MRKAEIIQNIADKSGIPKWDIIVILETFFKEVKESVVEGENVTIHKFGTFTKQLTNKRLAMSIKANITIKAKAHYIPGFKPAAEFKVGVRVK